MNRPIQVKQTTDSENRGGKLWPQFFKCAQERKSFLLYTHFEYNRLSLFYIQKYIFTLDPFLHFFLLSFLIKNYIQLRLLLTLGTIFFSLPVAIHLSLPPLC